MALKDYSDEFKADAVALYESTPGATYKGIAADLRISRGTLREWVLRDRKRRGQDPAAPPTGGRRTASADGSGGQGRIEGGPLPCEGSQGGRGEGQKGAAVDSHTGGSLSRR
jgi:transposase